MIICLVGKSGSGKSSVVKALKEYGYKNIVSYTTRPKRKGEKDGIDYHFVKSLPYEVTKDLHSKFAEVTTFNNWDYGTVIEDYTGNKTVVVSPWALRQLKKKKDIQITSFYIDVPDNNRVEKLIKRGDDISEICRRVIHDEGQFAGIEDEVNYVISNKGYKMTPNEIALEIHDFIKYGRLKSQRA